MRTRNTHLMLERISQIHQKIVAKTYPNQTTLAKEFEVSIPTISRDIEFMKTRLLAPIEYDRKKNGYFYTENFSIKDLDISSDKVQALMTIKTLLSYFNMTPIYNEAKNIIELLTSSALNINNVDITKRIALPPRTNVNFNQEYWFIIVEAMEQNLIIEFDYKSSRDDSTTHRKVHPYQILIDDGACYLYGYSEERKEERTFALQRMANLKTISETFVLPNDYEFEKHCGGGQFGIFSSEQLQTFTIEFYGPIRQYIKERTWGDNQTMSENQENQSLTLTFSSRQETKIFNWVLGYGSYAKPLAPETFVQKWKEEIKKLYSSFN